MSNEDVSQYLIPSKLSLKEKFKPNGEFDKLKSRQVAGGYMQDSKLYPDKSSPTSSINSIFIVSAIAAHKRSHVASSDIGNVYVNADISGLPVYMKLDANLAKYICDIDNSYEGFVRKKWRNCCEIKKGIVWLYSIKSVMV